jgi:hypothetical protein
MQKKSTKDYRPILVPIKKKKPSHEVPPKSWTKTVGFAICQNTFEEKLDIVSQIRKRMTALRTS